MKPKEISRDLVALGGIPFFLLVMARVLILPDWAYFLKLAIAGILFFLTYIFLKQDTKSGLSLILLIFITSYYNYLWFTLFVALTYISLIASLIYLKIEKKKILFGILIGLVCSLISHVIISLYA